MQVPGAEQDTPNSWLLRDLAGMGMGLSTDQLVPSHVSAMAPSAGLPRSLYPTAVHVVVGLVMQLTDASSALCAPGRAAVCWIVHWLPFQRSASASDPFPLGEDGSAVKLIPVAVQAPAPVQDSPSSSVSWVSAGTGASGSSDHWVPFHCSACSPKAFTPLPPPIAVQDLAPEHDTASRPLPPGPGVSVSGLGWVDHVVPFHRATADPTAVHADAEVHDTAWPRFAPPGVVMMNHLLPFHSSESPEVGPVPTAMQKVADVQLTPIRELLFVLGCGAGTGTLVQVVPFHLSASGTDLFVWPVFGLALTL